MTGDVVLDARGRELRASPNERRASPQDQPNLAAPGGRDAKRASTRFGSSSPGPIFGRCVSHVKALEDRLTFLPIRIGVAVVQRRVELHRITSQAEG